VVSPLSPASRALCQVLFAVLESSSKEETLNTSGPSKVLKHLPSPNHKSPGTSGAGNTIAESIVLTLQEFVELVQGITGDHLDLFPVRETDGLSKFGLLPNEPGAELRRRAVTAHNCAGGV
jgi:hypothetical protein